MNSFMPEIKKKGVKIHDKPIPGVAVCSREWKAHDTCCDEDTILTYQKQDKESIQRNQNGIKSYVSRFYLYIYWLMPSMKFIEENHVEFNDHTISIIYQSLKTLN